MEKKWENNRESSLKLIGAAIFKHPIKLFPIPYSLFPIPYSLFPTPYSLLPIPYSLFPAINNARYTG